MANSFLQARTVRIVTPDGTLFVHIADDKNGKLKQVMLNMGKAGTSVSAWAYALTEMMNLAIDCGATLEDLLKILSGITSGSGARLGIGGKCTSGPEGVWMALLQYRREKHLEHSKGVTRNERTLIER